MVKLGGGQTGRGPNSQRGGANNQPGGGPNNQPGGGSGDPFERRGKKRPWETIEGVVRNSDDESEEGYEYGFQEGFMEEGIELEGRITKKAKTKDGKH
jgi:hypothetical protein